MNSQKKYTVAFVDRSRDDADRIAEDEHAEKWACWLEDRFSVVHGGYAVNEELAHIVTDVRCGLGPKIGRRS
jgi:hypothetical protein